jgi:hypothetical protein
MIKALIIYIGTSALLTPLIWYQQTKNDEEYNNAVKKYKKYLWFIDLILICVGPVVFPFLLFFFLRREFNKAMHNPHSHKHDTAGELATHPRFDYIRRFIAVQNLHPRNFLRNISLPFLDDPAYFWQPYIKVKIILSLQTTDFWSADVNRFFRHLYHADAHPELIRIYNYNSRFNNPFTCAGILLRDPACFPDDLVYSMLLWSNNTNPSSHANH